MADYGVRTHDQERSRHDRCESDGSSKANPNRTSNRIVQNREPRRQDEERGVVFRCDGQAGQDAGRHEIAARAGFRQLDDAQEPDEHHARHRDVGHTEVRITDVKERESEARRSDESRRPAEQSRSDAKEEPDADHARGCTQETRHDSCGGRARLGQPKANLEPGKRRWHLAKDEPQRGSDHEHEERRIGEAGLLDVAVEVASGHRRHGFFVRPGCWMWQAKG